MKQRNNLNANKTKYVVLKALFLTDLQIDHLHHAPSMQKYQLSPTITLLSDTGQWDAQQFLISQESNSQIISQITSIQKPEICITDIQYVNGPFFLLFVSAENLVICTDLFGQFPLFYAIVDKKFLITTELQKKLILEIPFDNSHLRLLDPQKYVLINLKDHTLQLIQKPLPSILPCTDSVDKIVQYIGTEFENAYLQSIKPYKKIGVLFSGGVDSTACCQVLKNHQIPFHAYTVGRFDAIDIQKALKAAQELDFPFTPIYVDQYAVATKIQEIESIILTQYFQHATQTVPSPVTMSCAITYYFGMLHAALDGCDAIVMGTGAEELFAGFHHWDKSQTIDSLSLTKTFSIHKRDLHRDTRLAAKFQLNLVLPFLNVKLALYALSIPSEVRLLQNMKKGIWRKTVECIYHVPHDICFKRNNATQYGSKTDRILELLSHQAGFHDKKDFVESLYTDIKN